MVADRDSAAWPMPNGLADVAAGAPNPENYRDNGDETITDNVTGLIWQKGVAPGTYTQTQATAYCPTLTLAGRTDWRLPSFIELVSILDYGQAFPIPTIDAIFTGAAASLWSSTPVAGAPQSGWLVNFAYGNADYDVMSLMYDVRCVTTSAAPASTGGRYTMADGVVYDAKTKLTWQQVAPSDAYAWMDAKVYCAGLAATLTGTWRLPTIKELLTIVDFARTTAPRIDPTAFPATLSTYFWSSTPLAGSSTSTWYVGFDLGYAGNVDVSTMNAVRCVR